MAYKTKEEFRSAVLDILYEAESKRDFDIRTGFNLSKDHWLRFVIEDMKTALFNIDNAEGG